MNQTKNKLGKISVECMMNSSNSNGLDTMKVTLLELRDVGGISHLKLGNIDPQMNIICGENGVGKTNILDSIAYMFSQLHSGTFSLKQGSECGSITIETDMYGSNTETLKVYGPTEYVYIGDRQSRDKLLYLKVNRVFDYVKTMNISQDKNPEITYNNNIEGVSNEDLKNWLILRQGFNSVNLTSTQQLNTELARKAFSALNKQYTFSKVSTNFEVFVNTPSGEIHLELLSSGFKSSLFIVLGIIKELDIRFNNIASAQDYDGIILIDEVELHLHPEWQGRICSVLKEIFPKAQFFITTHSPHVVQTAGKDEVIALERKDNEVVKRELPTSEYGYQGWTIEEILEDVMGMPDLRTSKYKEVKARFDKALDDQNKHEALAAYQELDKMLHPQYPLRPVFKMQLDSLGE